jgi:hypothetical protein
MSLTRDAAAAAGLSPAIFDRFPVGAPDWFAHAFAWAQEDEVAVCRVFGADRGLQEAVEAAFVLGGNRAAMEFVVSVERELLAARGAG